MTTAADIPGYVQGHRFAQDSQYWNSGTSRFIDQAGYTNADWHTYCEVIAGSPAFSTHGANAREGLLLDNSCHLRFLPAIPWEGTMLVVFRPTLATASVSLFPWIFGDQATTTNNPRLRLRRSSGVNDLTMTTVGTGSLAQMITPLTGGAITICAYSLNQEDRKIYSTQDGVTISGTSAAAGTANGNPIAIGKMSTGTGTEISRYARLGNNSGTAGSTTANATDYAHVFEQHFWKGDALNDQTATLAAFIADLETYYGI